MMITPILIALAAGLCAALQASRRQEQSAVPTTPGKPGDNRRNAPSPALAGTAQAGAVGNENVSLAATREERVSDDKKIETKESAMEQAQDIIKLICGYLDEMQYRYEVRSDGAALRMPMHGKQAQYTVAIFGDRCLMGLIADIPLVVPEEQRVRMAETIARANFGLKFGSFELDMSDGELRFRAGVPMYGEGPSRDVFLQMFHTAMWSIERYFRAFARLLYADDMSPAEVIAEVEMAK